MSYTEKLQKLEEEKNKLIEKRQQEILKIITNTGAIDIDNKILTGLLLFLKNPTNKNHSFLKEISNLSNSKTKIPSRAVKEAEPA